MSAEPRLSETELLLRLGAGDQRAFELFYDRTVNVVCGVARRFLRDESSAEDLVQEVYLQVWEKGAAFNPALGKPITWLITLTRNRAIDRLRAMARSRERFQEEEAPVVDEVVETEWLDKETVLVIRRAVGRLPSEQRRALELAYFQGFTQTEIAEELREPLGTIKARIRRAMLSLRETLKHCAEF